jgi:FlaA1/EpsC-like NDP-sugar epimerase
LNPTPNLPPPELVLGRPEFVSADAVGEAGRWVVGRRVLVTGAGGSIGWPLAHALAALGPELLVLVDHHEHSLFLLERSLGRGPASCELLDVRDARAAGRLFERARPDLVIHLAAAKHVPYGERFPGATVASNVLATARLLELAAAGGVGTFVYPSSDKSVDPPSLYGATKRLAEALVQRAARGRTWYVVRFVNIIGTRGSVIETFARQIEANQPLTVTDDRMTRYWMSTAEALWLLLLGERAGSATVVMPECGEPVPVVETARRLAAWYRPERAPYPIVISGIRPGERLHEVLLSRTERFLTGPAPGARLVGSTRDPACLDRLPGVLETLAALVERDDGPALRQAALAAAQELQ